MPTNKKLSEEPPYTQEEERQRKALKVLTPPELFERCKLAEWVTITFFENPSLGSHIIAARIAEAEKKAVK